MEEYQLIDSGEMEKLERFGNYTLIRPEPKALWQKQLSEKEWSRVADARFDENEGKWVVYRRVPKEWSISFSSRVPKIEMILTLTSFKHIGLFPEQLANWDYIYNECKKLVSKSREGERVKVLNLFAYTGGASLAAKAAGADVTHLDSVKQVVTWARRNMEQSSLSDIRWIVEDAIKFVEREGKRGNRYSGIILDPPAFGYGRGGERWKLDQGLFQLLLSINSILKELDSFLVLNLYSNGYTPLLAESVVKSAIGMQMQSCESGELFVKDGGQRALPLGVFVRVIR